MTEPETFELGSASYRVMGELGRGGTSVVYEARRERAEGGAADDACDEAVAIKVFRDDLELSEREQQRFLREAERMRRVHHPGLATVFEAGTLADGRPYLLMPRLSGLSLAARLEHGPVPPEEAVRIFAELARAVHAVHEAGMVHRDIKPENVLLVRGSPVLLDFGIARDMHEESSTTTREGRIRGTPAYMAPERFFGEPASIASDIYELGVVLYAMLAGRLPWSSGTKMSERLHPGSVRLSSGMGDRGAGISPALAAAVLEALSTRPEIRPKDAARFALDVEAALRATGNPDSERVTADLRAHAPRETPSPSLAHTPHDAPSPASAPDAAPRARPLRRSFARVFLVGAPLAVLAAMAVRGTSRASPELAAAQPAEVRAIAPAPATANTPAQAIGATPPQTAANAPPPAAAKLQKAEAPHATSPPKAAKVPEGAAKARTTAALPIATARSSSDDTYFEDRQ
ncbi:protein kinase domain-containing protein [Pendulispora albinea]|uniref:Protein kinase n=1 Tax=Pendulispora albinea TaxID=2741071 RepID=A0ABZ2LMB5_9BACT